MAKMKTRCYYTEYVNHMIRFYLTCPDSLPLEGKKRSDMENWIAVQAVLHIMDEDDREKLVGVFKTHYNLPLAVKLYCEKNGYKENDIWVIITKTLAQIARRRGLV